jgi:hypothetical protein
MNLFELISILLMIGAVLLIYYVEFPRLRRETRKDVEIISNWFGDLCKRVKEIESARGTFSRQLENLTAEVDSNITSIRQNSESTNRRVEQLYRLFQGLENTSIHHSHVLNGYLDSIKPKKARKSGK